MLKNAKRLSLVRIHVRAMFSKQKRLQCRTTAAVSLLSFTTFNHASISDHWLVIAGITIKQQEVFLDVKHGSEGKEKQKVSV